MRLVPIAVSLVVALGLTASAAAQVQLETLAGKTYEGEVVSDDGTDVEFTTAAGMTLSLPYANLTAQSRYTLRSLKLGTDATSHLELAEWCVTEALYPEARLNYQSALEADPGMSEKINASIKSARTAAGKELLERAKALQADGRPKDARHVLSTIVQELPLEPAAKEAASMLAADNEERKSSAMVHKRPASSSDGGAEGEGAVRADGEPFSDEAKALFAHTVEAYHSLLDNTHKGLVDTSQSGSIKHFEKALKDADKARREVDKVRKKADPNEELTEALTLVDSRIEDASVDCRINLVDAYLLRESYTQAGEVVKAGLANYPDNAHLRSTMNRVTSASAESADGAWIVRRGGLVRPSGGGRGR